jgi:hypothetical protein
MRRLLPILLCLLLQAVQADEQLLLRATNDQDSKVDQLFLRLDGAGHPTHLLHRKTGKAEKVYTTGLLAQGVVLRMQSGQEILTLKAIKLDPDKGAAVVLTYLYSAIPPAEYRSVTLLLRKEGTTWSLFRENADKPLKALHFQTNLATALGFQKPIGIRTIKLMH